MDYFRFPTRFLLFVDLALALLAGFGLAACAEAVGPGWRRFLFTAWVLAVTAVDLWVHQMDQVPQVEMARWLAPIDTERILSAARQAHPEPWRYHTLDASLVHAQTYHGARGWSGDLTPYLRLRALLQPSFNLLFDLDTPDGYSNLVPRYYEAVWGSEKRPGIVTTRHLESGELEPGLARALRLFNVRYVLSVAPLRSPLLRDVARSAEGVEVYELADPFPRAFVVGAAVAAANDEEAVARLASPSFDPEREAVIDDATLSLPPDAGPSREVEIVRHRNTEVAVHARLEKPGLLVLSEGYYPGWRVSVDGAPARLLRVNLMMRGVVVPAGEHTITFRFRSKAIGAGLLISVAAMVMLVGMRRRLRVVVSGS